MAQVVVTQALLASYPPGTAVAQARLTSGKGVSGQAKGPDD
jgi:hypothetical protein